MTDSIRRLWSETVADLSTLGSFQILFLFGLGSSFINRELGISLLVGLCVVEVSADVLKLATRRTRPDGQKFTNLIERIDAGSLPSVHAARCLFVTVTLLARYSLLIPVLLPACLLVGLSRVLLRRHHLTDVLAGYALGAAVALLVGGL